MRNKMNLRKKKWNTPNISKAFVYLYIGEWKTGTWDYEAYCLYNPTINLYSKQMLFW